MDAFAGHQQMGVSFGLHLGRGFCFQVGTVIFELRWAGFFCEWIFFFRKVLDSLEAFQQAPSLIGAEAIWPLGAEVFISGSPYWVWH